jgi:hypothetical protein
LDIWYAWINVSEAQTIFYALTSDEVNPPIKNFLSQHFQVENETEVFIGTTLLLIEVYNDADEDGIPQANFTSGEFEIAYYLEINSSVRYETTPIRKILENGILTTNGVLNTTQLTVFFNTLTKLDTLVQE